MTVLGELVLQRGLQLTTAAAAIGSVLNLFSELSE